MRIFILGAQGMLGKELVKTLSDGHEVVAFSHQEIDITDPSSISKKLTSDIDVVINATAYNNVDKAEEEKEEAFKINAYAVGTLADICSVLGIILVHYSTEYVFDGKRQDGYLEEAPQKPLSVYGHSKALGEKLALEGNERIYLIRTSRLFGSSSNSPNAKKSFVEKMLELSVGREELEVVDEEVSSPTYVSDLAEQTRFLLELKKPFGIYHITNTGSCTWYGFAQKIFEFSGKKINLLPIKREKMPAKAMRPKYAVLLNSKLPPLRRWEEALASYLKDKPY